MSNPALVSLIIFGGGWGAEGTQASIEAHVLALKSALSQKQPHVLFASGDPKVRDVQVSAETASDVSALLGVVFDRRDHLAVAYRSAKIPNARPASKRELIDAIRSASSNNTAGTIVFGAGHGTPAEKGERAALELFGLDESLSVDGLAKELDLIKLSAPLAFVLGHCHSGAFTELAYTGADPKARLAEPVRCVLAAVPPDRQASGCSADVADPSARAYLALIAEALVSSAADADKNGRISLAEAHAHARIHDLTVDLPVTTSEMFLVNTLKKAVPDPSTLDFDRVLQNARPADRRVLLELRPAPNATPANVRTAIERAEEAMDKLDDALERGTEGYEAIRRKLLDELLLRFPELANPYHHEARRLLAGDAPELVAFLKSKRELLELEAKESALSALERERFELEKKTARLERWLRAVVTGASEAQLRKKNKRDATTLDKILACEALEP
jgi:hypothetical protein